MGVFKMERFHLLGRMNVFSKFGKNLQIRFFLNFCLLREMLA